MGAPPPSELSQGGQGCVNCSLLTFYFPVPIFGHLLLAICKLSLIIFTEKKKKESGDSELEPRLQLLRGHARVSLLARHLNRSSEGISDLLVVSFTGPRAAFGCTKER